MIITNNYNLYYFFAKWLFDIKIKSILFLINNVVYYLYKSYIVDNKWIIIQIYQKNLRTCFFKKICIFYCYLKIILLDKKRNQNLNNNKISSDFGNYKYFRIIININIS